MSGVLLAQTSGADAVIVKDLVASSEHQLSGQFWLPSSVLDLLQAGAVGPDLLTLKIGTAAIGIFPQYDGGWGWNSDSSGLGSPSGTVYPDTWNYLQLAAVFLSGTTWLVEVFDVDAFLFSYNHNFGFDTTAAAQLIMGAFNAPAVGSQRYYGTDAFAADASGIVFEDLPADNFDAWDSTSGDVSIADEPSPPPGPMIRFGNGFPWRLVVTDLHVVSTTWADGLYSDQVITFTGNQASTIEAAVDPDDFRVNGLWTDGYPRIAQSNRLVFAFRREGPATINGVDFDGPWICRAAGILMSPDDSADATVPVSRFTAWDPWKYLEGRPATDEDGNLPGPNGFEITGPGNETALQFLKNTILNEGGVFLDAGTDWGGTSDWAGTIETTDDIVVTVNRGDSVADVWANLCSAGNLDVVLTPVYDVNRFITVDGIDYYFTHDVSIYNFAGSDRPAAMFAWDMMQRNVERIERVHDGTPGAFFNKVQYFTSQNGYPIPPLGPLVNAASVSAFYSYWSLASQPDQASNDPSGGALYQLAAQALALAKQGRRTLTLDAISSRAPVPLRDYNVFDLVPVWATRRLRAPISSSFADNPASAFRVQALPIQISDDGVETVSGLVLSPDFRDTGS